MNKIIEKYKEDIIRDTQDLLRIKSVESDPVLDMPFGEGVQRSLEKALEICKKLGMDVENIDNYAGHAQIGQGEEVIGILCHLDVVPEGQDWDYDPYGAQIEDGKIFARGALDDKGPAVASIYAMKIVQDLGIEINKKIRIIFGTNEETGGRGIEYYLERVKAPDMAFTPDGDFPVIHGEKGILVFKLEQNIESSKDQLIKKIVGGNAPNMVCDLAKIVFNKYDEKIEKLLNKRKDEFEQLTKCNFEIENSDEFIVKSKGKSAHGSTPENGINAISGLIMYVYQSLKEELKDQSLDFLEFYQNTIGMDYNGQNIGCGFEDLQSGKLIFNVGMIDTSEDKISLIVNIRYPITYTRQKVYDAIRNEIEKYKISLIHMDESEPLYIEKDNKLVQSLMKVYKDVTGDYDVEPIVIGGGTYARSMKNAVAFGPLFPNQEDVMHQKNEFISIEQLLKLVEIYAKALIELMK